MLRHSVSLELMEIPSCPICLIEMTDSICSLECGHCFHRACLQHHLTLRSNCPICRTHAQPRHLRYIYFNMSQPQQKKESAEESASLRRRMRQMEFLISTYEQGTLYVYEQINDEQQENMRLKLEVEELKKTVKQLEMSSKIRENQLKAMLTASVKNQKALLLELKVLKVTMKAKEQKERYRLQSGNWLGRINKIDMKEMSMLQKVVSDTEKKVVELRKSSSVPDMN